MIRIHTFGLVVAAGLMMSGMATAQGTPAPASAPATTAAASADGGIAAFYNSRFHGRKTACKDRYNQNAMTAASNAFACGAKVKVTNLKNSKSVVVRINDKMPVASPRVIDLSRAAAKKLGFIRAGTTEVKMEQIGGK